MNRSPFLLLLLAVAAMALPRDASAQYYYGSWSSISSYQAEGVDYIVITPHAPRAKRDSRIDSRLVKAARIADEQAFPHSHARCWQYVKNALLEAGVVDVRPSTNYACEAGSELTSRYGFVRLPIHDPYSAPIGALLVYEGGTAGHVEFRTEHGFASDYHSQWACRYHLIGVYAKLSA